MKKSTKLYIMFAFTVVMSLLIPMFTKWYEAKIGVYPTGFVFIIIIGGYISYLATFTDNFKKF